MGAAEGVDDTMAFFADDAVWDSSRMGFEIYKGRDAIRRSFEEWFETFGEHEHRARTRARRRGQDSMARTREAKRSRRLVDGCQRSADVSDSRRQDDQVHRVVHRDRALADLGLAE
jgi:ketosteroid isomerase-like protein